MALEVTRSQSPVSVFHLKEHWDCKYESYAQLRVAPGVQIQVLLVSHLPSPAQPWLRGELRRKAQVCMAMSERSAEDRLRRKEQATHEQSAGNKQLTEYPSPSSLLGKHSQCRLRVSHGIGRTEDDFEDLE